MADPVKEAPAAAAPAPGTPEYETAMSAKATERMEPKPVAAPAPIATEKPTKPEGLPDKFWNAEKGEADYTGLAKSYSELEKKLGAPAAPVVKPAEGQPDPVADAAKAAAEKAGIDFSALQTEYAEKKALSPETYAALAAKGFAKGDVDTYIAGKQAQADAYDSAAFTAAGSEEAFKQMSSWASNSMKPAEIEAFNTAVTSGSVETMKLAVAGLRASYEAAKGKDPTLITGTNASGGDVGYASMAEQKVAQRDPRYKADPAYRASVERKIGASTFHNVQVIAS